MNSQKWLYAGGRPKWLATILNRCFATIHTLGINDRQASPMRARLTVWGRILLFLFFFIGFGAVAGGVGVMKEMLPFPEVWLQGTPFHGYFYPGLILCLVVGSSQFAAAFILLWRSSIGNVASLIAGLVLAGWMVGELRLIGFQAPIQGCFVAIGMVEVGLSFARLRRTHSRTPRCGASHPTGLRT